MSDNNDYKLLYRPQTLIPKKRPENSLKMENVFCGWFVIASIGLYTAEANGLSDRCGWKSIKEASKKEKVNLVCFLKA